MGKFKNIYEHNMIMIYISVKAYSIGTRRTILYHTVPLLLDL